MKVVYALVVLIGLTGCEQTRWTRSEIIDIAEDTAPNYDAKIEVMERRITDLEEKLGTQAALTAAISSDLSSTQSTVSNNAKVHNANAVREMTRRGACGKEWVAAEDGRWVLENKRCTEKDLTP